MNSTTPKPAPFQGQAGTIQGILAGDDDPTVFQVTATASGCVHLDSDGSLDTDKIGESLHLIAHQLGAADPGAGLIIPNDSVLSLAAYLNAPGKGISAELHATAQVIYARANDLVNASRASRHG